MIPRLAAALALGLLALGSPARAAEIDATGEERIRDPEPRKRHFVRATEEIFLINGPIGVTWYWTNADLNQADWDLRWDWPSWRRKIVTFDAVRFDSNDFGTNAFNHSLSGTAYYWTARANGLSIGQSFLMANLGSFTWEYIVEFKEYPSLNDLVFTPFVGIPFGESIYQLGELFDRGSDAVPVRILAEVFGLPRKLHDRLDGSTVPRAARTDALGLPTDTFHAFGLHAAVARATSGRGTESRGELGLDSEVVTLPRYGGPGHAGGFVTDRGFSRLGLELALGERRVERLSVSARATVFGYYHQEVARTGAGAFVGAAVEFEFMERWMGPILDRLGVLRVGGLALDATFHAGSVTVRAACDVAPDFAMVAAMAWPAWKASAPATKSVLVSKNYYYALGLSVLPSVTLRAGDVTAGFAAKWETFRSIDGVDRFQETLASDATLRDQRLEWRAFFSVRAVGPLHFFGALTERHRSGTVAGLSATDLERTVSLGARFAL